MFVQIHRAMIHHCANHDFSYIKEQIAERARSFRCSNKEQLFFIFPFLNHHWLHEPMLHTNNNSLCNKIKTQNGNFVSNICIVIILNSNIASSTPFLFNNSNNNKINNEKHIYTEHTHSPVLFWIAFSLWINTNHNAYSGIFVSFIHINSFTL